VPRANKTWPARETQDLCRKAADLADDPVACRDANIELVRTHQRYMIPYSAEWMRAELTIRNLQAQR
jgi:hypothetical protein